MLLLAGVLAASYAAFRLLRLYPGFLGQTLVEFPHGAGRGALAASYRPELP